MAAPIPASILEILITITIRSRSYDCEEARPT